jgi:hypothetical protein
MEWVIVPQRYAANKKMLFIFERNNIAGKLTSLRSVQARQL